MIIEINEFQCSSRKPASAQAAMDLNSIGQAPSDVGLGYSMALGFVEDVMDIDSSVDPSFQVRTIKKNKFRIQNEIFYF
jgi:hypothetical protein